MKLLKWVIGLFTNESDHLGSPDPSVYREADRAFKQHLYCMRLNKQS